MEYFFPKSLFYLSISLDFLEQTHMGLKRVNKNPDEFLMGQAICRCPKAAAGHWL